MGFSEQGSGNLRHNKPNPPNMRRKRYAKWLDKAADLLRDTGEARTANWLIENLPDNRHSPPSANSAAQKMKKDKRFKSYMADTQDLRNNKYKTHFFFYDYNYKGETDEK